MKFGSPILLEPTTALIGGGIGSSLLGGLLAGKGQADAAKSQNAAGLAAMNTELDLNDLTKANLMRDFFGGEAAYGNLSGGMAGGRFDELFSGGELSQEDSGRLAQIEQELANLPASSGGGGGGGGSPASTRSNRIRNIASGNAPGASVPTGRRAQLEAERDALKAKTSGKGLDPAKFRGGGMNLIGKLGDLRGEFGAKAADTMNRYDADTNSLMAMFAGERDRFGQGAQAIEDAQAEWGKSQEGRIERDASREVESSGRTLMSDLAGSGVADGALAGALRAGNSRQILEQAGDRKDDLADNQITKMNALRLNRLGVDTNLGMKGFDTYQGRLGGRTSLDLANQDRDLGLARAPIEASMQIMGSPAMTRTLSAPATAYMPGASSSAGYWGNVGSVIGNTGGQLQGAGMMQALFQSNPELFKAMYK